MILLAGPFAPTYSRAADIEANPRWALEPLRRPRVPFSELAGWSQTPVDSFMAVQWREKGLAPSPPASRRVLVRRAFYDLTGLLPTPREIEEFEDQPTATEAFGRLVDRLLASPRYGERWARYWMDAVHFAETHGHDEDAIREHAWPYRDYLINSFNQDKPYARFVQEQVAGDVLFPGDPQALIATGFLAAGPWDASSQMGIQDGTIDKKMAQYLDRDDMIVSTMGTFMSLTVHCARCHDHKFDPISLEDYYALQAVFAGVDRADRAYDSDPEIYRRRLALERERRQWEDDRQVEEQLRREDFVRELNQWDAKLRARLDAWEILHPTVVQIDSGSATVFDIMDDGSILFGGARPERDTYVIRVRPGARRITAFQLEVLTDPSLPHEGPGRQDNGNLHLSEIELEVDDPQNSHGIPGKSEAHRVSLGRASADFNQHDWSIDLALDGNPQTAWGIYPNVGMPHQAVFALAEPLVTGPETVLIWRLAQLHGGGHLLGRPRLSFTEIEQPEVASVLPENLRRLLVLPVGERTPSDRLELARYFWQARHQKQIGELPQADYVYTVASDFPAQGNFKPASVPRSVHVLPRGDIQQPGPLAKPGALSCVAGVPGRFDEPADVGPEGWRRAALARWLTHENNGLLWRSMANRVWLHHFGRGLVNTPNDFGRMGERPSHPQLLDWLACELRDHGGSLKHLHRIIMNSAVYQQTSRESESAASNRQRDPGNLFLSRMNLRRRDAESIRDGFLQMSGHLDESMGGPSDRQFLLSPGVHVTPNLDYAGLDPDDASNYRRSVYRFIFRTVPDPFMQALDCPDASQWVGRRNESITPSQAMALMNNRFVVRQSELMARRIELESANLSEGVDRLAHYALGRDFSEEERCALLAYARKHGLANACRFIMNCNEFVFVE